MSRGSGGAEPSKTCPERCQRPKPYSMTPWSRALAMALIPWFAGCSSDDPPRAAVIVPVSSSATPLSAQHSVALVDDQTACVIVSYESEVRCLDRTGELVGVFGGEGDGPGEFRFARAVVRGPKHTVAVIDPLASRVSIFKPTGELVTEVAVPEMFEPMSPIGETMIGTYAPDLLSHNRVIAEVDLAGGAVLQPRQLRTPSDVGLPGNCGLSWGAMSQEGVATFGACKQQLLFYSESGDGEVAVIEPPTYTGELPNQRDIDEHRQGARFLYGGGAVPEAAVSEFANTPKPGRIAGRSIMYDGSGRLWVGTRRDRDRFSYFDLYFDTAFAGSVRVRDRLLGFDILNGTLVTLVERTLDEHDDDGIPDLGIDWYDIGGLSYLQH